MNYEDRIRLEFYRMPESWPAKWMVYYFCIGLGCGIPICHALHHHRPMTVEGIFYFRWRNFCATLESAIFEFLDIYMLKFAKWTRHESGHFVLSNRLELICQRLTKTTLSICLQSRNSEKIFITTFSPISNIIAWNNRISNEEWIEFLQKESFFLQLKSWISRCRTAGEMFESLQFETVFQGKNDDLFYHEWIAKLMDVRVTHPTEAPCIICSKSSSISHLNHNLHVCSIECLVKWGDRESRLQLSSVAANLI